MGSWVKYSTMVVRRNSKQAYHWITVGSHRILDVIVIQVVDELSKDQVRDFVAITTVQNYGQVWVVAHESVKTNRRQSDNRFLVRREGSAGARVKEQMSNW